MPLLFQGRGGAEVVLAVPAGRSPRYARPMISRTAFWSPSESPFRALTSITRVPVMYSRGTSVRYLTWVVPLQGQRAHGRCADGVDHAGGTGRCGRRPGTRGWGWKPKAVTALISRASVLGTPDFQFAQILNRADRGLGHDVGKAAVGQAQADKPRLFHARARTGSSCWRAKSTSSYDRKRMGRP